ncbi:MAG: hypothetical protein M0O99_01200 [Desulfuromonas thiophila]|nr:hypothetical protein [Desulfuromonas thiophila]
MYMAVIQQGSRERQARGAIFAAKNAPEHSMITDGNKDLFEWPFAASGQSAQMAAGKTTGLRYSH